MDHIYRKRQARKIIKAQDKRHDSKCKNVLHLVGPLNVMYNDAADEERKRKWRDLNLDIKKYSYNKMIF